MKGTAAQYMNEIVSLTVLALMGLALVAGQAAASGESRRAALDEVPHEVEIVPTRLERTADARLAPLVNALPTGVGRLRGQLLPGAERDRLRRPAVR